MKHYEFTYLISQDLTEEELKTLQEKINSFVQEEGGLLGELNLPRKKKLAFPIKKKLEAYLATLNFQLSPEKLLNFEKKIKAEPSILRYLILTKKVSKVAKEIRPRITKKEFERKPKVELKEIEEKLEEILGEP